MTAAPSPRNVPGAVALDRLRYGNRRFVADLSNSRPLAGGERRAQLASDQRPFAIVLGCSDSRAPAEIVFDQGLGDLFVIRVAGNIVAPSQVGSVEFAAEQFGTRLVVVMGHSHCGAIAATLSVIAHEGKAPSAGLSDIVERIRPALLPLLTGGARGDPESFQRDAVRANVVCAADQLRHGSPVLEEMIAEDGLLVVGAAYDIESGVVDFFDGERPG